MTLPLLIVLVWLGCSIERDYKMLSLFFDGVPDPNAIADGRSVTGPGGEAMAIVSEHVPYINLACQECHQSLQQLRMDRNDSSMCNKCHQAVPSEHRFMHGPVVGDACLWCHRPHSSPFPNLLRNRSPNLCIQCHSVGLMESQLPSHEDLSRDCLECHSGHGGDDPYFLHDALRGSSSRSITGEVADE